MSTPWHRNRGSVPGRAHGGFGFYDSAYQIALVPQDELEPAVVVDHEITHVYLVQRSSMGLLERILLWLEWSAHEQGGDPRVIAAIQDMTNAVLRATESTHEAIAWLGTEMQTEEREELRAPPDFAPGVQRLRKTLEGMPGRPEGSLAERHTEVMTIADEIGVVALDLPLMRELWEAPEQVIRRLDNALRTTSNAPQQRFEWLCSYFETVPYAEALSWAKRRAGILPATEEDPDGVKVPHLPPGGKDRSIFSRRRAPLPVVRRTDLPRAETAKLMRTLLTRVGLHALVTTAGERPANVLSDDELLEAFDIFDVTHGFLFGLDRYAQTCVLDRREVARERPLPDDPVQNVFLLDLEPYLIVSRNRTPSVVNFARRSEWVEGLLIRAPMRGEDEDGTPLSSTWTVDEETARPFLRSYSNRGAIIASSVRYDLGAGDFEGMDCLVDIPHVVVAISDFRSLWMRLISRGLAESSEVEWKAMPSPAGRKHYGFLVLKPADRSFPVVLNPSPVEHFRRVVSVAEALPSPRGVRLRESLAPPPIWLGAMEHAVMTAAAVFEVGSRPDAVMMAALAYTANNPQLGDSLSQLQEALRRPR